MKNIVIYPGTFDPITNGHVDLIQRAANVFDKLIIAIAENPKKKPFFSWQDRIDMATDAVAEINNIEICGYDNLLIDFAKQKKANIILRGLRAVSDFEYEFQLAGMNRRLASEIETVFMTPAEQYAYVSSTLVKEIAALGGDVSQFVPAIVCQALAKARQK